jgi:hypothetical protein
MNKKLWIVLMENHCTRKKSTLRLPGMNAGACSGLTLSLASRPRLERRGFASANG